MSVAMFPFEPRGGFGVRFWGCDGHRGGDEGGGVRPVASPVLFGLGDGTLKNVFARRLGGDVYGITELL